MLPRASTAPPTSDTTLTPSRRSGLRLASEAISVRPQPTPIVWPSLTTSDRKPAERHPDGADGHLFVGAGDDDRLVEAEGLLEAERQRDAVLLPLADPDLHLAALARIGEQADHRPAAETKPFGNFLLGEAVAEI